jgi:hypothetical protein
MAKRYTVTHSVNLQQNNDANTLEFDEQIDLSILLSRRLQRNIRQGHVFKVHKVAFGLSPIGGDLDTGLSVSGSISHCPATKNSVKAWQIAFNTWRKQKQLRIGAVGQGVRYDDFEVAWSDTLKTSRTSSLYAEGMNDSTLEDVVIFGNSTSGSDVTLEDIYTSLQEQIPRSRFPLSGIPVKDAKFSNEFPTLIRTQFGGNWSTVAGTDVGAPDSGASYNFPPVYLEDKNTLCGVLNAKGYLLAEDVTGAIEDELALHISITCEISTPLVSRKPKSKRYKPKGGAKRGRSSRYRRKRS